MIEAIGNHQYYEKMDGSRRIVLRNRKHLKPVEYFKVRDPVIERPMIKEQVRNDRSLENEKPDKGNKVVEEIVPTTPTYRRSSQGWKFKFRI